MAAGAEGNADSEVAPRAGAPAPNAAATPDTSNAETGAATQTEARPLEGSGYVTFFDDVSGMSFDAVHDADREIVYFDAQRGAMISAVTGDAVSGWSTSGTDLRWSGRNVAFRVRFGTESGQRRAFFTETAAGTICNLEIAAPELLSIYATRELPPQ